MNAKIMLGLKAFGIKDNKDSRKRYEKILNIQTIT